MSNYYVVSNELYHHGILGQKWGIRRYQNPDGSLTLAGKEHYAKKISGLKRGTFENPEHYSKRKEKILRNNPAYKAAMESIKDEVSEKDFQKAKRASDLLTKYYDDTISEKEQKELYKIGKEYRKRAQKWGDTSDKVIRDYLGGYYNINAEQFSKVGWEVQKQVMDDLEKKYYGKHYYAMYNAYPD